MKTQARIAVVDDDPHFAGLLEVLLESYGYGVTLATSLETLLAAGQPVPDVVILDWQLGEVDGLELIAPIKSEFPGVTVVLATAHASPELAVEALQRGAGDFLVKPVDEARLVSTLAAAVRERRLNAEVRSLRGDASYEGMVGGSTAMRAVYDTIENVAPTDVSVMVTGESGTGKELVASALHARSRRSRKPFVALNMAAIPRELVESTLFGHERGAFSGANERRLGAVSESSGGTLFLDEIGEMPLELQSKLLRFLQERVYRRVGGNKDLSADVRIVSATNRDPLEAVRLGTLRADLYYRLNVVPVTLPPLREREGDVALLATTFLHDFADQYQRPLRVIEPRALTLLESHPWPGNVRELRHFMERLVITEGKSERLSVAMVAGPLGTHLAAGGQPSVVDSTPAVAPTPAPVSASPDSRFQGTTITPLAELERQAIEHALEVCEGSRKDAAEALGISQATIYRKLKAFGINP